MTIKPLGEAQDIAYAMHQGGTLYVTNEASIKPRLRRSGDTQWRPVPNNWVLTLEQAGWIERHGLTWRLTDKGRRETRS